MRIRTKIFDFSGNGYGNLSELAQAMGISVSQIYRVREGKRHINEKFIVGAIRAFPDRKLDDLFYLAPDPQTAASNHDNQQTETYPASESFFRENELMTIST